MPKKENESQVPTPTISIFESNSILMSTNYSKTLYLVNGLLEEKYSSLGSFMVSAF